MSPALRLARGPALLSLLAGLALAGCPTAPMPGLASDPETPPRPEVAGNDEPAEPGGPGEPGEPGERGQPIGPEEGGYVPGANPPEEPAEAHPSRLYAYAGGWKVEAPAGTGEQPSFPVVSAVDAEGTVYVVFNHAGQIVGYSPEGEEKAHWGREGSGPGRLAGPADVAVDAEGRFYVAEEDNKRVQILDRTGRQVGMAQVGADGFESPVAIATAPDGSFFVLDEETARVTHFSADGVMLGAWGEPDGSAKLLTRPFGLAVTPEGEVLVSDTADGRIHAFDAEGHALRAWGGEGTDDGLFQQPAGIAVDAAGRIVVADRGNHRIQVFDAEGKFIESFGAYGTGEWGFARPVGLAIGPAGDLYVSCVDTSEVKRFNPRG
ncbi:MAG: NHL repeat-containing protein [Pseudomonadota bacterium]